MRRVLVVTWALGTASGVLLGLFGVQLVSSRFSTARVSPLSHPEVLRALQAARSVPVATDNEVAAPTTPDTATPPTSPPTDAAPARPSAGATSTPVPASPASSLPRPGATAGPLVEAAGVSTSSSTSTTVTTLPAPVETSTTTTTVKSSSKDKSSSDDKKSDRSSTTTTTAKKSTATTSSQSSKTRTKTFRTRGGVVTVKWDGDTVTARAWPDSGWDMARPPRENGPDRISVWFGRKGEPAVNVVARSDGESSVTEWRCNSRWECTSRRVD